MRDDEALWPFLVFMLALIGVAVTAGVVLT